MNKSVMSDPAPTIIRVEGDSRVLNPTELELAWQSVRRDAPSATPVILDLSRAPYIDNETLPYILALISEATSSGLSFQVDLPALNSTRLEYLRAWRFIEAAQLLADQTGVVIWTERSRQILSELPRYLPRYQRVIAPDPDSSGDAAPLLGLESTLSEAFFALTPLILADGPAMAAKIERSRWLKQHVIAVLNSQLTAASPYQISLGELVATDIVYEAVMNVARHPKAHNAFLTSQLQRGHGMASELVLSVWDDGQSFNETLRAALNAPTGVISELFGTLDEHFTVSYGPENGSTREDSFTSKSWRPRQDPVTLMTGAFLLGVTSFGRLDPLSAELERPRATRGQGLQLLRNAAIMELGGIVTYASGRYRMTISSHSGSGVRGTPHYSMAISELHVSKPFVRGNLLTIRLPVRSGYRRSEGARA